MIRCDFCHKATHYAYVLNLGGVNYSFCSGMHANEAAKNYYEKVNNGIKPEIVPDNYEEGEDDGEL